jgi:hypothetical protein
LEICCIFFNYMQKWYCCMKRHMMSIKGME